MGRCRICDEKKTTTFKTTTGKISYLVCLECAKTLAKTLRDQGWMRAVQTPRGKRR